MNEISSKDRESERLVPPMERTYFGDLDSACVERIANRYGNIISPERIAAMRDLPTHFDNSKEFAGEYKRATGRSPEEGVAGFSQGVELPAHVVMGDLDVPEITMHERMHQAAHPDAARIFGTRLYEGVTQDLAVREVGREPEPGEATGYPEERRSAKALREVCGPEAVEIAYFQGDASKLKAALDRNLGIRTEKLSARMKTWEDQQEG